jgi:4-amino-4-deoxy-L-arabinose transferase-like glycosyltransferase
MSSRFPFAILLAVALCIRLVYVFWLPLGQTVQHRLEGLNDEPSHLNYVHYLAEHKQFPVQHHHARENDSFIRNEFEYYQPPVYYMIGAGCEFFFGASNTKLACRFLSFFFGVMSLLVIYKIFSRCGFPGIIGQGAVLFAAFFPAHAYFCSVVSNDSLSWLCCLLLTLEISADWAKIPDVPVPLRQKWLTSLRVGALLGIGMLIKSSLFVFYPVMAVFFLYRWFISKDLQWLGVLAVSFLLSGILSAPWYFHNLHLYGSFFAFGIGNGPPQFFLFSEHRFIRFLFMTFKFFWFPMQHVPASHAAANLLRIESMLLIVNIILCVLSVRSRKRFSFYALLLCLLVVLNIAAYLKFNLYWDNAEGRYFFPSLVPMLMFFCVPVYDCCRRFGLRTMVLPLLCAEALFPYVNLLLAR